MPETESSWPSVRDVKDINFSDVKLKGRRERNPRKNEHGKASMTTTILSIVTSFLKLLIVFFSPVPSTPRSYFRFKSEMASSFKWNRTEDASWLENVKKNFFKNKKRSADLLICMLRLEVLSIVMQKEVLFLFFSFLFTPFKFELLGLRPC